MAVVKRYNTEKVFFSDRILEKLSSISNSNLTIVEAPTGYGKTTAVKNYLNSTDEDAIWITVENEDSDIFFEQICNVLDRLKINVISEFRNLGTPKDAKTTKKIIDLFTKIELQDNCTIVLDNFQFIKNKYIKEILSALVNYVNNKIRLIIITQNVTFEPLIEKIVKKEVNYIGKSDLEFDYDDITSYFRECGIRLGDDEVNYLLKYTEGWISAIYLQMLCYIDKNTFEIDTGINNLVCTSIWEKLSFDEQIFFTELCIFDSFSLKQAIFMANDIFDSDEVKSVLKSNSFIRYDQKERKYYIHAVLRYFLISELDKLDVIDQKDIYQRAAGWFEKNELYYRALKCYYKIGKYDEIYYMNISIDNLLKHIDKRNKTMFLKIITSCSYDAKSKNIRSSIVFCIVLFLFNEMDFFENECNVIEELIENTDFIINREKEHMLGEIEFVKSYLHYNNIDKMQDAFIKAFDYLKSPSTVFSKRIGITFRNPSVLGCYHSRKGELEDEIEDFEDMMTTYYKITQGESNGAEVIFRAEMLYYQCQFDDAQMLCHKALYYADTRGQVHTYISTMLLMAKIAIFNGDYDNVKYILSSIRKKAKDSGMEEYVYMSDLCDGCIYMMLGKENSVPYWLKDTLTIENRSSVFTLAFCNMIYGKYLICTENYEKFIGISGAMLGSILKYNNILYEIYIYIYIAISNFKVGNSKKASKFLYNALELAYKDNIVVPFIENYQYIQGIHIDSENNEINDFMAIISEKESAFQKELKAVTNSYKEDEDYGLTQRELEIAKLAAKRYTNKEIATKLYISTETVKSTLKSIFAKLEIGSRNDLKNFFLE